MEKEHEAVGEINRPRFSLYMKILLWIVLPLHFVLRAITSPISAALIPALLIPASYLVRYDRTRPVEQQVDLEAFIWTFVQGGLFGSCAVAVVQTILSWIFIFVAYRGFTFEIIKQVLWGPLDMTTLQAAVTNYMKQQHTLYTFVSLSHHLVTAISEASLSYFALMHARRHGRIVHEHNCVTLGAAAALGYITVQSHIFLNSATQMDYEPIDIVNNLLDYGWGIYIMSGRLTGLGVARRDFRGENLSLWKILYLPVLFHCIWVFSMIFGGKIIYSVGKHMGLFSLLGRSAVQLYGIIIISVIVQGSLALVLRGRFVRWEAQQKKSP